MAATISKMVQLGTKAPEFSILNVVDGTIFHLLEQKQHKAVVIMFICNHCPYVIYLNNDIVRVANHYMDRGILFIAISSNDVVQFPQDSPEIMKDIAIKEGYPFPYLYDETQNVAKSYGAECTPDFFVFNSDMALVYRGQFDDSRPGNHVKVTGKDLSTALDDILNGLEINPDQKPSIGCNIKWII